MAENSNIEWTHHTFNPWIGCTKISPACDNCYAETWDKRYEGGKHWGAKAERRRTSAANWKKPLRWNAKAEKTGQRFRVFCASLADVFDNKVNPAWREDLFNLIKLTPHLDWLILTKRPQNIKNMLPADWTLGAPWNLNDAYQNVWLGTTVENQEEADRRIPLLLEIPAKVKFLSMEPLLGEVNISSWLPGCKECSNICGWRSADNPLDERCNNCGERCKCSDPQEFCLECGDQDFSFICPNCDSVVVNTHPKTECIDWVITGGESGSNYRHSDPNWFKSLKNQCVEAGVPFLFKQWGGTSRQDIKFKGRLLDGIIWDEYPVLRS